LKSNKEVQNGQGAYSGGQANRLNHLRLRLTNNISSCEMMRNKLKELHL